MIIWIDSYPRSGNTLYRMLLYHVAGIKTYSAHGDPLFEGPVGEATGHITLPFAPKALRVKGHAKVKALIDSPETYMVKTHARVKDLPFDAPVVYIVRDGRDTIVSFTHYQLQEGWGKNGDDYARRLQRRVTKDSTWGPHVTEWLGRAKAIVRYEDMLSDPVGAVRASLDALGLSVNVDSNARIPTFEELQGKSDWFFRRGQTGGYKDEMPEALQGIFWQRFGKAMEAAGYAR